MKEVVNIVNDIVWSPALVVLLVGAGLYFSVRTRFVQVRRIGLMIRLLFAPGKSEGVRSFSPFQAFCLALSGRVGTGNIVGVATAIAMGGPGAVFWMWVTAFLGASTAYTESTLAQMYKFTYRNGYRGGPFSYIEKGLRLPWLGMAFAITTIVGYGMLLMLVQANGVSSAFFNSFSISPWLSGGALAIVLGMVVLGGAQRIAHVATAVTPFMAIVYILLALVVIGSNAERIPYAFELIFSNAFGINPLAGGILGSTIAFGVKRGLFSNEAGEGGGAIVSGSANNDSPVQQGLVQAFSVYIDTLLVCTATALMIICTGCFNIFDASTGEMIYCGVAELGNNYVAYTQSAIDTVFQGYGNIFVTIALLFFAFTTIMAYYFYAESSIIYMFSRANNPKHRRATIVRRAYQCLSLMLVVFGAVITSDTVWTLGDIGVGLTTWINMVALIVLFPQALHALQEYENAREK
ncbi:MAG: alanine/glycine:cation symporter family protein [Bacteroidales bacterium]|nr:alanine/glycine:cation symporter family protein [Bacteroidales bacterium]